VAEWFKAAVLKTAVGSRPPWVRIPPHPPPDVVFAQVSKANDGSPIFAPITIGGVE
jgi:hypothetical protein